MEREDKLSAKAESHLVHQKAGASGQVAGLSGGAGGRKGGDECVAGRCGSIRSIQGDKIEQVNGDVSDEKREGMAKKTIMMRRILWNMAVLLATGFYGFSFCCFQVCHERTWLANSFRNGRRFFEYSRWVLTQHWGVLKRSNSQTLP